MKKLFLWFGVVAVLLAALALAVPALPQNPQTQTAPLYAVNAKYANGTTPGYWATQQSIPNGSGGTIAAATGLNINIGPGTANCGSGNVVTYAGGTLALTASATNRIYLNTASSCAPAVKTSAFTGSDIPVAVVVTSGTAITSISDVRTFMVVAGSGSGIVSGQAAGVVPLAGGAALINAQSHIDENTPGVTNVSQELTDNSSVNSTPAGVDVNTGNDSSYQMVRLGYCPNVPTIPFTTPATGCDLYIGKSLTVVDGGSAGLVYLPASTLSQSRGGLAVSSSSAVIPALEYDILGNVYIPHFTNVPCLGTDTNGKIGSGSGCVTFSGDLSGTSSSQTVIGLRGISLPSPSLGYLFFDGSALNWFSLPGMSITSSTSITLSCGQWIRATSSSPITITLPSATAAMGSCQTVIERGISAGAISITPTTGTYDGVSANLQQGQTMTVVTDGTNWHSQGVIVPGANCSWTANLSGNVLNCTGGTHAWQCQPGIGDGLNVIPVATYPQTVCLNTTGSTVTLTGFQCFSDDNGTSTVNVTNGSNTALLTGAITCTTSFASGTQSGTTTLANGDYLKFSFVADGVTKQSTWIVKGTY